MAHKLDHAEKQDLLSQVGLEGKAGSLPAREQAKAWALREVRRESGKSEHGMPTYIAGKLQKTDAAGKLPTTRQESPSPDAVKKLFDTVDEDDEWHPGKSTYENTGAPALLSKANRAVIANCAMNMKKMGEEPTYPNIIAACPRATLNPKSRQPFSKDTIYSVLPEDCYDEDPCLPWEHKYRFSVGHYDGNADAVCRLRLRLGPHCSMVLQSCRLDRLVQFDHTSE